MNKILKNVVSDYGYNLVALPKEDIQPLGLLSKEDGYVSPLGNKVTDLFDIDEAAPPQVAREIKTIDLAGSASVSYEANSGISMLDWLLDKLKLGKLKGKIDINNSKVVTITYDDVLEDKINLLDLDKFLSGSTPVETKFNTYRKRLQDSELYVINSVLKSKSFTVSIQDANGTAVDVEATVKGMLDASQHIKTNKNNSFTITNDAAVPLIFAFKAQRILYDKKAWWQFFKKESAGFTIKNQTGVTMKGEDDFPSDPLNPEMQQDVEI